MPAEFRDKSISAMEWLGRYSMTDVMVLALMIFYINASGYTEASVLPGIYFFAASTLMTMLAYGWANSVTPGVRDARGPASLQARLAELSRQRQATAEAGVMKAMGRLTGANARPHALPSSSSRSIPTISRPPAGLAITGAPLPDREIIEGAAAIVKKRDGFFFQAPRHRAAGFEPKPIINHRSRAGVRVDGSKRTFDVGGLHDSSAGILQAMS